MPTYVDAPFAKRRLINALTDVAAVGAATTIQAIVAVSAEELIVSGSGVQLIVTRPAADQVAAAGIANNIVPSTFWMTSEANAPSMISFSRTNDGHFQPIAGHCRGGLIIVHNGQCRRAGCSQDCTDDWVSQRFSEWPRSRRRRYRR